MEDMQRLIKLAIKKNATDVHIVTGAVPYFRVDTKLYPVKKPKFTASGVKKIVHALLNQEQMKKLEQIGGIDLGTSAGKTQLRINIHKQTEGLALAIRILPENIPTPEEIGMPEKMRKIVNMEEGFVVVSGQAGSGKSTSLASLIQAMNKKESRHIITLEDPVEYKFTNGRSLIEQRQLTNDFASFPQALRTVLRQDPDVIMVGEMRDPETISLALTAAETGHLVISTLHAPNASEAVERIVNVFEGSQQQQVLVQLAATLEMIVAQKLLSKKGGGLIAAFEVLVATQAVQNGIRQNDLSTIRSAIQTGSKQGMVSMDRSIKKLKKEGLTE